MHEQRAQQLLRRNAGTTTLDVGLVHTSEQAVNLEKRFIDHRADRMNYGTKSSRRRMVNELSEKVSAPRIVWDLFL